MLDVSLIQHHVNFRANGIASNVDVCHLVPGTFLVTHVSRESDASVHLNNIDGKSVDGFIPLTECLPI